MAGYYNKDELKDKLEVEQIFDLLELWGGEPEYTSKGLVAQTICHNLPGEGSRKLYYYSGTKLFVCYTGCQEPSFDIFELCIKVKKKQEDKKWELYDAMEYIATYFGFSSAAARSEAPELEDWEYFKRHASPPYTSASARIQLPEYNPIILSRFSYPRIGPWEKEGISPATCKRNFIGYYPGGEQITIPHFDIDNRLIGIRGRTLVEEVAEKYGKYMPLKIGKRLYTHPLSMNLYNLNNSSRNIRKARSAIIYESEKSCLMHQTYYGLENDISVACCGSSISNYHIELLRSLGVQEIIIAFDRQFVEIGDEEFKRLKAKLIHIRERYGSVVRVSAIFDKHMITPYKASPIDIGPEVFEQLLKERIIPC